MRKRHRVHVKRRGTTQDGAGQRVETWSTLATVSAAIRHKTGRELDKASGEHSRGDTEITFWYAPEIATLQPGDRIDHGGRVYDIQHVNNVHEKNHEFVVQAQYDPAA